MSKSDLIITVSQRTDCGHFAKDCDATFSLDGNSDNALMMAGYAVEGIICAHRGDTLLVEVRLHGRKVARHVGVAGARMAEKMSLFVNGRMNNWDLYAIMLKSPTRSATLAA